MNCWYWRCGAGGAVGLRGNANTQAAVLVLRTPVVVRTPRGPARRPSWPDGQPVRALVLAPSKAADGRREFDSHGVGLCKTPAAPRQPSSRRRWRRSAADRPLSTTSTSDAPGPSEPPSRLETASAPDQTAGALAVSNLDGGSLGP